MAISEATEAYLNEMTPQKFRKTYYDSVRYVWASRPAALLGDLRARHVFTSNAEMIPELRRIAAEREITLKAVSIPPEMR